MPAKYIHIKGAREHNLKNVELKIPRDSFVVFTGLSGSGKSSLAFDTVYAEGHRRFVESLSSYARMFLGQIDKPDVDFIDGLSPAISIDQKTTSRNPRSTVGTVTEIYDYLRLLYARIGIPHCPICGKEIRMTTTEAIIEKILALPEGEKFMIASPVVREKKGMHEKTIESARKNGYSRARVDGEVYPLEEIPALDKNKKHSIDIIVDRLVMRDGIRSRLADSVETALSLSDGLLTVIFMAAGKEDLRFSQKYACEEHGISIGELTPRMFSFNAPFGACPRCSGLGELESLSPDKIIPDRSRSLRDGAIVVNGFKSVYEDSWYGPLYEAVGKDFGFTIDTPIRDYSEKAFDALMNGVRGKLYYVERSFDGKSKNGDVEWLGVIHLIEQRRNMTHSEYYDEFMDFTPCPECGGKRLRPDILAVTVGGLGIDKFNAQSVEAALKFVSELELDKEQAAIAGDVLKEIRSRLR